MAGDGEPTKAVEGRSRLTVRIGTGSAGGGIYVWQ